MQDQHKLIKGYRDLTQTEIDLMNAIKVKGNELGALIEDLQKNPEFDQRFIASGKTKIQYGIQGVIRGITRPEGFC